MWDVFFFNDTATTEIYTLSLHDALPICRRLFMSGWKPRTPGPTISAVGVAALRITRDLDRKSTRLNSSHVRISYAGFCFDNKHNHVTERPTTSAPIRR